MKLELDAFVKEENEDLQSKDVKELVVCMNNSILLFIRMYE